MVVQHESITRCVSTLNIKTVDCVVKQCVGEESMDSGRPNEQTPPEASDSNGMGMSYTLDYSYQTGNDSVDSTITPLFNYSNRR